MRANPEERGGKKGLRVLYVTQQFFPEMGAAAVRASEFARYWSAAGVEVSILTGFPSYLSEKIAGGYRNRLVSREKMEGYDVIRTFTLTYKKDSIIRRFISQLLYAVISVFVGIFSPRCDVVIATSPPFTALLTGYLISRAKRCRLVTEIRDLFPASAVAFGVLREGPLVRFLTGVEAFFYRRSVLVVGVTRGIVEDIRARGLKGVRVRRVTNGVNTEQFRKKESASELRERYGASGRFVVMYTGIFGRAQNLEALMETAAVMKDRPDILFVLVGEGVEKSKLLSMKASRGLENVVFIGGRPPSEVPDFLSAADAGFTSRRSVDITRGALPVKMFEYMACELPVIFNGTGEAEEVLKEAGAGIAVTSGNPLDLKKAVISLADDAARRRDMGRRGRAHVEKFFSRRQLAADFLGHLQSLD
jgi:glycosyltransferase involved in cell wall biosynthesis